MPGIGLLHKWLRDACPSIHRARLSALVKVVHGLLAGGRLTLTDLGRQLPTAAFVKHNIKCVDRLLGNAHLQHERVTIYRAVARWVLTNTPRPVLLVDWSDCEPGHKHLMLKAAVPLRGRALSIYEEVYPLARYNSPRTHRRFLRNLKAVLPAHCRPIIVTDAGFRGPWFREVERYGWDWLGRVRNKVKFALDQTPSWRYTTTLYPSATPSPRYVGRGSLARKQPYACHLYLVRKYRRGPGRSRQSHGQGTPAKRARKLYKDPWLIATSLPNTHGAAKRIMKLYALRMQIEETFRDYKGRRWGFGLQSARSRDPQRWEILLLIGTLATVILWLVGLAASAHQCIRHFQANTLKKRAVLSICFLGQQLLHSRRFHLTRSELLAAAQRIPALCSEQTQWA
jgi:Transposase DDE domain